MPEWPNLGRDSKGLDGIGLGRSGCEELHAMT